MQANEVLLGGVSVPSSGGPAFYASSLVAAPPGLNRIPETAGTLYFIGVYRTNRPAGGGGGVQTMEYKTPLFGAPSNKLTVEGVGLNRTVKVEVPAYINIEDPNLVVVFVEEGRDLADVIGTNPVAV